ncbi:hypothetical protein YASMINEVIRUS_696 [Yasminevirus sp. GU-2018]|uniref:Uncharacterized protein n=1 Tax=Yasminevirus sp. GU-2018 TaxID=2420051 RepID=A0A5K0U9X4_9VIRU|nr:hypothetical protein YASMINEVIRUS_696 [Yasminevirus sp. GU-2018]
MSKIESIITLEYHKNRYTVAYIERGEDKIPIVLDRDVYKTVKGLNKRWYINDKNHIYCLHSRDGSEHYPVYLHEIVVKLSKDTDFENMRGVPIIHINNIHFDNRLENLQFDIPEKDYAKSTKKKRRIINLTRHGINVDTLPTYLWYLKPDKSHGDRFAVEIPNVLSWRSTASRKVSLRYKLEEAKKYLRYMKLVTPKIFEDYSMNGDLTGTGLRLYKEYRSLIAKAGFEMNEPNVNNTDLFLAPDTSDLTDFEAYLLNSFDPRKGSIDIASALEKYQSLVNDD